MNLILLGGNNIGNKKWIARMENLFKPHFETHTLDYKHWETGNEWINPEEELKRLASLAEKLKDYVIFARSAGTMITLMGKWRHFISPSQCVFVGLSVKWSAYFDPDYDRWLKDFSTPSLLIQNKEDPAISSEKLRAFLEDKHFSNYKLKELPGEDHYYGNVEELRDLTVDFLRQ